jgi:hypothetical protein
MEYSAIGVLESSGLLSARRDTRSQESGGKYESPVQHFLKAPEELPVMAIGEIEQLD